jgi:3',5'-cyclic-AMP phosphodiesterase
MAGGAAFTASSPLRPIRSFSTFGRLVTADGLPLHLGEGFRVDVPPLRSSQAFCKVFIASRQDTIDKAKEDHLAAVRLAIVADIHHGRDTPTKRGSAALPLLRRLVDELNSTSVQAVIDLGDRISDDNPEKDWLLQRDVGAEFGRLRTTCHHLNGNHDIAMLGAHQIEAILDSSTGSRVVDLGEVRLVLWSADARLPRERGFRLAQGEIEDLHRLLGSDDRRTLLFSHVPLSGHSMLGNYYFERCPDRSTYLADLPAIRQAIEDAPCPIACFAGHVHWNTATNVDGTPHLTLQSLTETFTTGEPAGSTALLEVDDDRLLWRVGGLDQMSLDLHWPRRKRRWLRRTPLPRETA